MTSWNLAGVSPDGCGRGGACEVTGGAAGAAHGESPSHEGLAPAPPPSRIMASVVVKTIWQSKEINEAGDPPSGAETRTQSTRDLLGKASPKGLPKKKKAVSFHGVEPPLAGEPPPRLNLKRSSACTNVSLLNLTGEDSESTDDGAGRGAAPLSPPLPHGDPAWSEDDTDPPTPLDMVTSGLVRAKDSVTSLKERASRVNRRVQSLQESCRKVSQSVEDTEIKTNALKKSSVLLEEKLRMLQRQAQGGELGGQGQEPEQQVAAGIPTRSAEEAGGSPTDAAGRQQGALGIGPEGRGTGAALEESSASHTAQALSQLRADIEGLRLVRPLLEDVARQLGNLRGLELPERPPASCVSQGCVSAQSLRQAVECAVAPLLEELRQRGLPPAPCPACQRLQTKILELEQATLENHARAETLSSNLRLAQDEALRAKTYVERVRLNPQEKPPSLDPLHTRLSCLQAQLSQEGGPQPMAPPPMQQR
ncbi:testis-specific serine kinase substrate isoform X2 [Pelodiscus sinensis]|uniref:testis-specific serine kinase substrate isoform X2 n=1 Tax=Pelodiscus sinensis TaxID=13735 RepID=UPI003F6BD820